MTRRAVEHDVALLATAECLRLDRLGAEVIAVLRDEGIDAILLKGPSIAEWLWPGQLRPYNDLDLLVCPSNHPVARASLLRLGFADVIPRTPLRGEALKSGPLARGDGLVVDLHRGLVGIRAPDESAWQRLWEHRTGFRLAGADVFVLDEPARAMHVALHAAQHKRHERPVWDLQKAVERLPLALWQQAAALSRELDAIDAFGGALHLVDKGRELSQQLGLGGRVSVDIALRIRPSAHTAHGWERLAAAQGVGERLRFIRSRLVPSPTFLREWTPIARRGRLGLAIAYPWRILCLIGGVPRGLWDWRRAKRAVRRYGAAAPRASDD